MNFNAPLLRTVRILLFPFSLLFALIIWARNKMFDKGILSSTSFNLPLIDVGNLSAGGTGKSPMVEFIARHLKDKYKVAVLSRGYKRKTSGYTLANASSTDIEIGDEPLQLYNKLPDITIAVGEERIVAIPQLLQDRPDTDVIILDDAFQHRYIRPGLEILLTEYSHLFTRDWYLPTGDLRDAPASYKRAHIIVVTKCPPSLDNNEKEKIIRELKPLQHQTVFFTTIEYAHPYHIVTKEVRYLDQQTEILMISGIANPRPLKQYIASNSAACYDILFNDHHIYTIDDLKEIRRRFENIAADKKILITTEKDAVRLKKFHQSLIDYPLYVLPIQTGFLFDGEKAFTGLISNFITAFSQKKQESDAR